jgi:starch synthase (maltosyl-transferring)
MPRSTRTQHESGPGAPSGATDAAPGAAELAAEHPIEEPAEGWSVLPRPHDRTAPPRIQILNPAPMIDCGRFPAKRTVGEWVEVSADVFRDGHEILRAQVRYRGPGDAEWTETPMRWIDREVDGDRWAGAFEVDRVGRWEFTVEAWSDLFATWRDELRRKLESGQHDLRGELSEGAVLLEEALDRMREAERGAGADGGRGADEGGTAGRGGGERGMADGGNVADRRLVEHVLVTLADANAPEQAKHDAVLGPELLAAVERHPDRHDSTCLERSLPLDVERVRARFGAWYELFPRSFGGFEGVRRRLPKLAELGFDVIYLPPIHPIGVTNRKGRNNSLVAQPGDPGSPWAIGGEEGGHDAIHPELGTEEEFERLVTEAREHGIEIALDFAIQCSAPG